MKIVVCDITGRTINYNVALCEALVEKIGPEDSVEFEEIFVSLHCKDGNCTTFEFL